MSSVSSSYGTVSYYLCSVASRVVPGQKQNTPLPGFLARARAASRSGVPYLTFPGRRQAPERLFSLARRGEWDIRFRGLNTA